VVMIANARTHSPVVGSFQPQQERDEFPSLH